MVNFTMYYPEFQVQDRCVASTWGLEKIAVGEKEVEVSREGNEEERGSGEASRKVPSRLNQGVSIPQVSSIAIAVALD